MPYFTLTSDTGIKNYLAGAARGIIYKHHPTAVISDITHSIAPFNLTEAAYFFGSAYRYFPEDTWHILLVNVYESDAPGCLLAWHNNMFFAVPDNGILPMILGGLPDAAVYLKLPEGANLLQWVESISLAIKRIENGSSLNDVGEEALQPVIKHALRATIGPDHIEGNVISIDGFENVIINIRKEEFDEVRKGRQFEIRVKGNEVIRQLSRHYADVSEGSKLAFFNTAGFLEIAVNKGNAASLFGLHPMSGSANQQFQESRLLYQSIRITFHNK